MNTDQSNKLDAIYNKIVGDSNNLKLIWSNPNPKTELSSAVTVNHDFSQYNCIIITTLSNYWSNNLYVHMFRCPNNSGASVAATDINSSYNRGLTITTSYLSITPNTSAGNYQSYNIPVKIYGLTLDNTSIFNL